MKKFKETYKLNESAKINPAYKSSQVIKKFIFGKYDTTSGRPGFVHPFNLKLLSRITRQHIEELISAGWTFDKIVISPVNQGGTYKDEEGKWHDVKSYAYSFLIVGKDPSGAPALWNRKETPARGAGQTYLQWEDHQMKASEYLGSKQFRVLVIAKKIKKGFETGDMTGVADGITEII